MDLRLSPALFFILLREKTIKQTAQSHYQSQIFSFNNCSNKLTNYFPTSVAILD